MKYKEKMDLAIEAIKDLRKDLIPNKQRKTALENVLLEWVDTESGEMSHGKKVMYNKLWDEIYSMAYEDESEFVQILYSGSLVRIHNDILDNKFHTRLPIREEAWSSWSQNILGLLDINVRQGVLVNTYTDSKHDDFETNSDECFGIDLYVLCLMLNDIFGEFCYSDKLKYEREVIFPIIEERCIVSNIIFNGIDY